MWYNRQGIYALFHKAMSCHLKKAKVFSANSAILFYLQKKPDVIQMSFIA